MTDNNLIGGDDTPTDAARWGAATVAIHGDRDEVGVTDLAPPIHVSTSFEREVGGLVYSREEQPVRRRLETVLGRLERGFAVVYPSGQAAAAAILRRWSPARVAIDRGYFGTHDLLDALTGIRRVDLEEDVGAGDLIWLETPKNPGCELEDIRFHVARAAARGAKVVVDSTLATPAAQQPLELGADVVVHSTSKFLGGHSDALGGVVAVRDEEAVGALRAEREVFGEILGSLECWLTLRGLRTLQVRVARQSATAEAVARWLEPRVPRVVHPALATHPQRDVFERQMGAGGGVLCFELGDAGEARAVAGRLTVFRRAVSLGGVESLVDWRHEFDPLCPASLLRLSVGLESPRDLISDLRRAIEDG